MELVCLWIDGYKNLKNILLNLNPKYVCTYKYVKDANIIKLSIENNNDYYNIFAENINLITIVGANGCGKTSIIEVFKKILSNNSVLNDCKYCLIMKNENEFIHIKSHNIKISSNVPIREQIVKTINGYPSGDLCNALSFMPFKLDDFNSDTNFYNSYDEELRIQDQINNYFYYDRFPESTVAFTIGRTINLLKKLNIFQGEYTNILFEKFGWEFNLKDCYNHIVLRLRNYLNNSESNSFPMSFPVVLHNNKFYYDFYELVNKIIFFKSDKYDWKSSTTKIEDVFHDIIFLSAVCEFGFYVDYIEQKLKDFYMPKFKENLKDNKKLGVIDAEKNSMIEEFFEYILSNIKETPTPEITFIEHMISAISDENLKYNTIIKTNETREYYIDALSKIKEIIENPKILFDILNEYFYPEDYTYKIKHEIRPEIDKFLDNDHYDEYTDDFSAIYISNYKKYLKDDFPEEICKILPLNFTSQYFHINLYKYTSEGTCYTFKDMSTGEQRLIKFFADILYCNPRDIYLIDEIDMSWHPEWHRKLISSILKVFSSDKFSKKFVNVVMTTHSPIPLSDLHVNNIIALKKCEEKSCCEVDNSLDKTFAANIHTLLAKQFFLESTIGAHAESKIRSIVYSLSDEESKKKMIKDGYTFESLTPQQCKKIIELIGEDVYKKILYDMYINFKEGK